MNEKQRAENEKKKEYLRKYIPTVNAVKRIEEEIEQVRHAKMNPSIVYNGMPRGNEHKDLSDYITVSGAWGDKRVRAGSSVAVQLKFDDITVNNFMVCEKVTHEFNNNEHTMNLTLIGGEFIV